MADGKVEIVANLGEVELRPTSLAQVYDRPIELGLLHLDPGTGEERYLGRYPAGLQARWHRHTAAPTIFVLEGRMEVNGEALGPDAHCRLATNAAMHHAPWGGAGCTFRILFHGALDVEPLEDPAGDPVGTAQGRG